ncbi:methyltransferase, FxLD system [Actinomadura sp. WMMB 499]|uniref:methyltransferase, FxLD system n=1 Tax=Actinomadura sp. WMMB 499 TaxID=1219491 RepID=UPI00159E34A0|nr:methyltransferase, FxLD system [Actinomadura sp. WMMB 499]
MPDLEWRQYNIYFPDRRTAGAVAAHDLRPALVAAQEAGVLHGWWFMRKHPWRLRYIPRVAGSSAVAELLDDLAATGRIKAWTPGIYEPETAAFGGNTAMAIAHTLFHHDSRHVLARAAQCSVPPLGLRETTALLCNAMFRAAGLDWYEQGDVWSKVAALRPVAPAASRPQQQRAAHRLMTVDIHDLCGSGPLGGYEGWISAFEQAGRALAALAHEGFLTRGLRAVLAHHVVFHFNRASLPVTDQAALAAVLSDTVFQSVPNSPTTSTTTIKVQPMTTLSDNRAASADELRAELADRLRDRNVLNSPAIEEAFRRTPRHLFLPGVPLDRAYADTPVYTKTEDGGEHISAASQPGIVTMMLEQLDPRPGDRILEAGAGTGYNAAIMAAVVGETGHVTTIDVDEDLVAGARAHLTAAGIDNVDVVLGDGALGHAQGAPFDHVIATVGAYEIPAAWLEQLSPDGRLVVPLRLRGTNSRSIVFERHDTGWRSRDSQLAVFMPLRGIGDDARRYVQLTPENDVTLQVHKDQTVNGQALAGVLKSERHEGWSGVAFPPDVSFEWLDLWLCLRLDNALMRMNIKPTAKERGQVAPIFGWGSMATVHDRDLAYLTIRPTTPAPEGGKLYEVGVIGHGPTAQNLVDRVLGEIRTWNDHYRARSVRFEIPDSPTTTDAAAGRFVLERLHRPITIIWE